MPSWDAVILGAGCAGLAAATALVEDGARVLVLEARPVLGGRASAVRDPMTGEKLDNGQHVLLGCYDDTLAFLARIGAGALVRRQSALALPMVERDGRRSELRLPPLAAPLNLLAGVMAWDALSWTDAAPVLRVGAALAARGQHGADNRRLTVRQWLERHGQTPRLIDLLWEPLAVAALNQPIDEAAADTFVEVLARICGPGAERAALVIPSVPLDELYAEPARRWLEARGSQVRVQMPGRVVIEHERVRGVEVRGERIDAPVVILAVPWFGLAQAVNGPVPALSELLDRAAATASSPIVTVNLWYDRGVMDDVLLGLPGRVFQWVFDKSRVFGRTRSHLSLVASGAAAVVSRSNDELVALARREVAEALPRAAAAGVRHASAVRERQATFSLAPGQPARPATVTPVEGLLLAGDWVDTGLPATIESAVVSGHRAAVAAARTSRGPMRWTHAGVGDRRP